VHVVSTSVLGILYVALVVVPLREMWWAFDREEQYDWAYDEERHGTKP